MTRTGVARKRGEAWASVQHRLVAEVDGALKRKPAAEAKLAGAARVLAPHAPHLRVAIAKAADTLARQRAFDRPLYGAAIRSLVEAADRRAASTIAAALSCDDAGGFATLSAATLCKDPLLDGPLARVAACRQAHLSFASEVARLARGESTGAHLAALAPMIKESHRIALCIDLFVPLVRAPPLAPPIAPALSVLRGAERHLGRWLVLAEVAARAGDRTPHEEALQRSRVGPASSRTAWSFVGWALDGSAGVPDARPNGELIARLSDRPSSDRDTTFLFRLADSRAACAKPMLDALLRTQPLATDVALRAARSLARCYDRSEVSAMLDTVAGDASREELRGLAAASLWDIGARDAALEHASALLDSPSLETAVWSALVHVASESPDEGVELVNELRFRRVQRGWVE